MTPQQMLFDSREFRLLHRPEMIALEIIDRYVVRLVQRRLPATVLS
jgi:hypothetical protein